MDYPDLKTCLRARPGVLAKGPILVLMDEDGVGLADSVAHHLKAGFRAILVLARDVPDLAPDPRIVTVKHRFEDAPLPDAVTQVTRAVPRGTWIGYAYNAEFLFYPFCEERRIGEMLAFHVEERRAAMTGVVVDLYAADIAAHPLAVDRDSAHLDGRGYYGLNREDPDQGYAPIDRQVDVYGGLRWRFEEHIPWKKRRIDRVMLFRARPDLTLQADFTLSDPVLNAQQCEWHHNLTCAMASFRTAKALMRSPGARASIDGFLWPGSVPFRWTGEELLNLGFMEPGQWF